MKVAALDLGSNTFLCLIAEVEKSQQGTFKITKTFTDETQIVRLGQDVGKTKKLHPEALVRAQKCLSDFKKVIEFQKPEKVLAMATSAARDSENRNELFEIGKKLGIPIEVIPGHQEAQITFQGSVSAQSDQKTRLVLDIGGGSTEFILGRQNEILQSMSLDIGCVRLTEKWITEQPTSDDEVKRAQAAIVESFSLLNHFSNEPIDEILAVAGTPTALIAAQIGSFDVQKIDGARLSQVQLQDWKGKLQQASLQNKIEMGLPAGRADVMLIGVLILLEALKKYNKTEMTVSTRGVRHGIALEMARRFLP